MLQRQVSTAADAPTAESAATEPASAAYGTVMPDDPAIIASEVQIPAADTNLIGYLARPSNESPAPVILVCHENRGLDASHSGCDATGCQGRLRGTGCRPALPGRRQRQRGGKQCAGRARKYRPRSIRGRFQERLAIPSRPILCRCGAGRNDRFLFWRRGDVAGGNSNA